MQKLLYEKHYMHEKKKLLKNLLTEKRKENM